MTPPIKITLTIDYKGLIMFVWPVIDVVTL